MLRNLTGIRGLDKDFIYLLQITQKYNLKPNLLRASILTARNRGNSRCGKVSIQMRRHGTVSSTYMFSVRGEWLAQADISNDSVEMLRDPPNRFLPYIDLVQEREDSNKLDARGERSISDLSLGLKGVCFKAVVVKKSDVRAVTSRDGTPLLVCSLTLSDGTGEIPLAVWNSQIGTIFKGDRVEVRNARVRSFRGQIQLSLRRKTGSLTVLETAKKILII
ncbi:MAG TPA: hypothetical protein VK503_07045 [Candidatus Bathyarchaeia archaeon]|nr:hypothetical protein [Candidatus Bathyarchaeia archaeon]